MQFRDQTRPCLPCLPPPASLCLICPQLAFHFHSFCSHLPLLSILPALPDIHVSCPTLSPTAQAFGSMYKELNSDAFLSMVVALSALFNGSGRLFWGR